MFWVIEFFNKSECFFFYTCILFSVNISNYYCDLLNFSLSSLIFISCIFIFCYNMCIQLVLFYVLDKLIILSLWNHPLYLQSITPCLEVYFVWWYTAHKFPRLEFAWYVIFHSICLFRLGISYKQHVFEYCFFIKSDNLPST